MNMAHLHLLLNHLPVLGVLFGTLLLLAGYARNSLDIKKAGLGILVVAALTAVPAFLTGEPAEEIVGHLPGVMESLIENHEHAAQPALIATLLTGVFAAAMLWMHRRAAPLPAWAGAGALALALISGGLLARAAGLGGQIRHTEIRAGAPQNVETPAAARQHDRDDDDDEQKTRK